MPERWHVSSAVVNVIDTHLDAVEDALLDMEGVEIHGGDSTRVIITIEGYSTGQLGDCLTRINLMPGVLAANMVFEHAEDEAEEPTCHSI